MVYLHGTDRPNRSGLPERGVNRMKRRLWQAALIAGLAVAAVMFAPGQARAATTWFYPSGACPQSSTGLDNCINNVASDGDTVSILAGTYHENGTSVNNQVTVTGPLGKKGKCTNPAAVTINADQTDDGFYIENDNVTIQCLQIVHPGTTHYGVEDDSGSINLHVLYVIIQDADIGVYTNGGAADGLWVKNSTIKGTSGANLYGIEVS